MRVKRLFMISGILGTSGVLCSAFLLLTILWPMSSELALAAPNNYAVVGRPTITAAQINSVLCRAGSPACGTGNALYSLGVKYGIDPAYALAFFEKESTFGKYGVAHTNLGLGNIRCTPGYRCMYGFRAYRSWAEGYADWYQLIRYQYVNSWHLVTIPQIVQRYAPPVENSTAQYIKFVESSVMVWRHIWHVQRR
ncbi:MAG: glucosaminidase domain-containing protein [Chloroflexi bacterium]|nr:glucosaminidase domain-containing protein [Chloroflexota bacterium]